MYKCFVILSCVALALGAVRREAPAAEDPLQQIQKHAAEFQKVFSEQLNALVNSKNTKEVQDAVKKGSDDVLQNLSGFSNSLQKAVADANGKAKEALEKTRESIEKTIADLRKEHPEVEQQANALKGKLETAVKETATNVQKLAKDIAANMEATNEKLAPEVKKAYDEFVKQTENVQKQIHEAATKQ